MHPRTLHRRTQHHVAVRGSAAPSRHPVAQKMSRSPAPLTNIDFQAVPELLRKLQMAELDMLIAVDRLCSRHHLTYYLIGGSALGAARHHGFIPWDGDVDVGMPREDFERFLQICSGELPAGLFAQTRDTDPVFFRHFAKVRNENTTFVLHDDQRLKHSHGVFIDIFPMDGAPSSPILQRVQSAVIWLSVASGTLRYVTRYSDHFFKRLVALASLCIPYDFWFVLGERALRWKKLETARLWGPICAGYYRRELAPREHWGTPERVEFEGYKLPVPRQLDAYLKHKYGDYLKLPPIDQRVEQIVPLMDLDRSYLHYPPWSSG
jgi:lipopolysaccharide cholinephosphotransferase